ncbi:MAG: DinB family protein [Gemmatimonadaceae bacterium]|nr:DinB family protein [Gemmatimonadaceae bacterium]
MTQRSASSQQLHELLAESEAVQARFDALDLRVSDTRWSQRPAPERWSVAECVAHLNLSSEAMLPLLHAALAAARKLPAIGARRYSGTMLGRFLRLMLGPAPRLGQRVIGGTRTPAAFVPGGSLPRHEVAAAFRQHLLHERELIRESEGLAIDRAMIESPFAAGAQYDAWSALRIVVRHELRHLVQAERALETLEGR